MSRACTKRSVYKTYIKLCNKVKDDNELEQFDKIIFI